ncbi:hypothetical protein DY000_02040919 [Brassica cretica]|uniref:Uncharacterized protein n=1 Tax=Brassica cretica TaxID=69181 RepID=A0ABQ7BLU9_BRACR|nr:hypothetical protein DY000_02040919 [Brassica cretica]
MEMATVISEDPAGAKEKYYGGECDETSRTENTLSEAGEENAVSGEVLTKPSERDLEKSPVKDVRLNGPKEKKCENWI